MEQQYKLTVQSFSWERLKENETQNSAISLDFLLDMLSFTIYVSTIILWLYIDISNINNTCAWNYINSQKIFAYKIIASLSYILMNFNFITRFVFNEG